MAFANRAFCLNKKLIYIIKIARKQEAMLPAILVAIIVMTLNTKLISFYVFTIINVFVCFASFF